MTEEEKKYKEEQRKRLASFIVGAKDSKGEIITKIFSNADEYVIYEIKTNNISDSIKVQIDTETEEDKKGLINNFNKVRAKYSEIKGLLYKVVDDTSLKVRIGHILSHAIAGNPDDANNQFEKLKGEINTYYKEQFKKRMTYLITSIILTSITILFSVLNYYFDWFGNHNYINELIYVCSAASIGGFISISRRLRETIFEKDVSFLYIVYTFERNFISILAGVIIYFAIKCDLIFGVTSKMSNPILGYIIFAVVAGFSETLVPNLLINIENKEK